MNELERVVSALVQIIESRFPHYLDAPFPVREMHEHLIPYRTHRNELGVDTNEYYELALTRLISGEGGYIDAPDNVRKVLQSELRSPNPDSARFREFGNVDIKLSALALSVRGRAGAAGLVVTQQTQKTARPSVSNGGTAATADKAKAGPTSKPSVAEAIHITTESPTPAITAAIRAEMTAVPPAKKSRSPVNPGGKQASSKEKKMPPSQRTTTSAALGGTCRYCNGALPDGRDLTYCPHCGQDLTVHHCPACSTELEVGWKFCVTCGRNVEK